MFYCTDGDADRPGTEPLCAEALFYLDGRTGNDHVCLDDLFRRLGGGYEKKAFRIDFVLDMVPFKVKRAMLLLSNVIFAVFNVYISFVMVHVIQLLGSSQTTMLRLPQAAVYAVIPFGLVLGSIRLIQDSLRLMKEDESNLGASKPSMDLAACEQIYQEKMRIKQKEAKK